MARPTINFTSGSLITADGTYYFEVQPNVPYSLVAKGDFGGGTLLLTVYDPPSGSIFSVTGASWAAEFEDGFTSPFALMALNLTGSTAASFSVHYGPIKQHVHDT